MEGQGRTHAPTDQEADEQTSVSAPATASASGTATGTGRKLGKVDRGREACNECRRHKIRCHPHADDPQHLFPCSRCERMNLPCEFLKHNRGRKRKRPLPLLSGNNAAEGSSARHSSNDANKHSSSGSGSGRAHKGSLPTLPPPHMLGLGDPRFPFISTEPDQPLSSPTGSRHGNDLRQSQRFSLRHMVGDDSSEEEESGSEEDIHARDPGDDAEDASRKKAKALLRGPELVDDPVRAGFVDDNEARWLFHLFMTHFNTALPVLEPSVHTHDQVRETSSFLYTAILCVTSRYLSSLTPADSANPPISPESAQSVHQQVLVLARDHLTWAFAEATVNVDVVKAMVILAIWKEPDDDKAGYHIDRAVLMGKELNLGRIPSMEEVSKMSDEDIKQLRMRQRVWLCLFHANSIFNMQFRLPMLILHTDPLVATAHHWLKRAKPDTLLRDTLLVCSTEIRRKFLHYRELLVGNGPDGPVARSALSLSLLTRSMNQDWDVTVDAWIRDIIDAGGTSGNINKPRVWTASLRLNLNLLIVNQTVRLAPSERIDGGAPSAIPAFHHCLNAATTVLLRLEAMDKTQLTFASDTLLHFALYAATLLSTLSRGQPPHNFESAEIEHCRSLILKTADALDAASSYPSDSPTLHAYYLRRLCQIMPSHPATTAAAPPSLLSIIGSDTAHHADAHAHAQAQAQAIPAPTSSSASASASTTALGSKMLTDLTPIDPVLQNLQPPLNALHPGNAGTAGAAGATGSGLSMLDPMFGTGTSTLGTELDMLFADFPWIGQDAMMSLNTATMWDPSLLSNSQGQGQGGMTPLPMHYDMQSHHHQQQQHQQYDHQHQQQQHQGGVHYGGGAGGYGSGNGMNMGYNGGLPDGPGPGDANGQRQGQGHGQGTLQGLMNAHVGYGRM